MSPGARRGLGAVVLAVLVGLLAAACAVPTGGAPTTIAPSDVPYGLAKPTASPSASPVPSSAPQAWGALVYLVAPDDQLVARSRDIRATTLNDQLKMLLADLAQGPTSSERVEHLSSTLPPDVKLQLKAIKGDTAVIAISSAADSPVGVDSRRAVAQIVLTATSLTGVGSVVLFQDGDQVDAPLPSGQLTTQPLTAADYAPMLLPPPPSATVAPSPLSSPATATP